MSASSPSVLYASHSPITLECAKKGRTGIPPAVLPVLVGDARCPLRATESGKVGEYEVAQVLSLFPCTRTRLLHPFDINPQEIAEVTAEEIKDGILLDCKSRVITSATFDARLPSGGRRYPNR